jgi:hypothetical protein
LTRAVLALAGTREAVDAARALLKTPPRSLPSRGASVASLAGWIWWKSAFSPKSITRTLEDAT